jgi:glycosyltransferase involved in cell wall biosynthesis
MKILILANWYPSEENPAQGLFVQEHARAMAAAGAEVRVLHFNTWPAREWYRRDVFSEERAGIRVYHLHLYSRLHKPLLLMRGHLQDHVTRVLDDILEDFHPDLLNAHVVFQAGIIARRLSRRYHIPYVVTEHWSGLDWFSRAWHMPVAGARRAYRDAAGVTAVSGFLAGRMREYMRVERDIRIIPNVVDTGIFYPPAQDESPGESPVQGTQNVHELLCVTSFGRGRVVTKRPDLIADAMALMPAHERENYRIRIVGGGEGLNEFRERVGRLGLSDRIELPGYLPPEQVAGLMREAVALLHPTEIETYGVVVAEALCCGLPCIVSRRGALPDLVSDGVNGMLIRENTAEAWLEAIRGTREPGRTVDRNRIAAGTTGSVSPENVGAMWMALFNEIAGSSAW